MSWRKRRRQRTNLDVAKSVPTDTKGHRLTVRNTANGTLTTGLCDCGWTLRLRSPAKILSRHAAHVRLRSG